MNKTIFIFIALIVIGTTAAAQSITVTAPNGGETWAIGSTQGIRWSSTGLNGNVKIGLFKAGAHLGNIVEQQLYATGYNWHVGDPLLNGATYGFGNDYQIQVQSEVDWHWKDLSNANFSISIGILGTAQTFQPSSWIRVATPLAPLTMSHSFRIGWNYAGVTRDVNIYLHGNSPMGGDRTYTIATGVSRGGSGGLGHYDWVVGRLSDPESTMLSGEYQIEVSETGTGVKGLTRTFSIVRPAILVFEPRLNETLRRDLYKEIRWVPDELRGRVHIEAWYVVEGRTILYTRLFADIRNSGSQYWHVFPPPDRGHSEANPPPTGRNTGWFIRLVSAECPGFHVDSRPFFIE